MTERPQACARTPSEYQSFHGVLFSQTARLVVPDAVRKMRNSSGGDLEAWYSRSRAAGHVDVRPVL